MRPLIRNLACATAIIPALVAGVSLNAIALTTSAVPIAPQSSLLRANRPIRTAASLAGVPYPLPAIRVEAYKSERRLRVLSGATPIKDYRIALGGAPVGTKQRQGDSRTPEGDYYICTRLVRSRFHRFLGISYPGPTDAERARRAKLISPTQQRQIAAAHRARRKPDWDTPLGGAIGLHGGGTAKDWTLGCIALENEQIEELFAVLKLGTPVRIHP